jgi:hypothetical protein
MHHSTHCLNERSLLLWQYRPHIQQQPLLGDPRDHRRSCMA